MADNCSDSDEVMRDGVNPARGAKLFKGFLETSEPAIGRRKSALATSGRFRLSVEIARGDNWKGRHISLDRHGRAPVFFLDRVSEAEVIAHQFEALRIRKRLKRADAGTSIAGCSHIMNKFEHQLDVLPELGMNHCIGFNWRRWPGLMFVWRRRNRNGRWCGWGCRRRGCL